MTIRNENLAMGGDFGDAHWSHLSDEEYLMERSRQIRSTDPVEAKCWIITAKTMFPRNMAIRVRHKARPDHKGGYLKF